MTQLRISSKHLDILRRSLLDKEVEQAAILFLTEGSGVRKLVRDLEIPQPVDYEYCDRMSAQLTPTFVARVVKQAKVNGLSLAFVHSHPGTHPPEFSLVDDAGEAELAEFLARRGMQGVHLAMVISQGGLRARVLGAGEEVAVISVGDTLRTEFALCSSSEELAVVHDRQVRAFGAEGQKALQGLKIAIVGLGGTGSLLAQQLIHLGVRDFLLIDPDTIDITNLNRVVGTGLQDVGKTKVEIAARYLHQVAPDASIQPIQGDVTRTRCAKQLAEVDVIFSCTDSHGSRSVLQQVAYQNLIPCIDMGSTITVVDSAIQNIFGRVQLLSPGQPCLWCTGLLNSEQIRQDLMSDFERQVDPYIVGHHEPAPAVISLNATVVSLATTMFLGLVTEVPVAARSLIYNAKNSTVKPVTALAKEHCFICSASGVLARGIHHPLFARGD